MSRKHSRQNRADKWNGLFLSICVAVLVMVIVMLIAQHLEARLNVKVENAGKQMTTHLTEESTSQVFMNDRWYQQKSIETLLVMGIDDFGTITSSGSYNNAHQADFLMLFIRDRETGDCTAIHLNRDTMANITMLGVTGEKVGTQYAQIALAFNYGRGLHDSSKNTADAVSNLLYGMKIDHYITVTMDAVPIINDWAGGVLIEVLDDMTSVDSALVYGEEIKLTGAQALSYVRTRKGLDNSTNIKRMERQRQYAFAWAEATHKQMKDKNAVTQLVMQLNGYYYSDCTMQELVEFANRLGENPDVQMLELPGKSIQGEMYMEFQTDDAEIQRLVLETFYQPVKRYSESN